MQHLKFFIVELRNVDRSFKMIINCGDLLLTKSDFVFADTKFQFFNCQKGTFLIIVDFESSRNRYVCFECQNQRYIYWDKNILFDQITFDDSNIKHITI